MWLYEIQSTFCNSHSTFKIWDLITVILLRYVINYITKCWCCKLKNTCQLFQHFNKLWNQNANKDEIHHLLLNVSLKFLFFLFYKLGILEGRYADKNYILLFLFKSITNIFFIISQRTTCQSQFSPSVAWVWSHASR